MMGRRHVKRMSIMLGDCHSEYTVAPLFVPPRPRRYVPNDDDVWSAPLVLVAV